jgi:formylglycine-generating enzyme required for sulfatase activity
MELVAIPAGTFQMGSPAGEKERNEEERMHEVRISKPFYMGKYPVTQEQYEAVTGLNPSRFKNSKNPVEQIYHKDAQAFCEKVNDLPLVKSKLPAGYSVQLPTEAQWEYACRAGTKTSYYSGDSDKDLGDYAWFKENSDNRAHPVGEKKPNAWGLYDMNGNVYCWCRDWKAAYTPGKQIDPEGPANGHEYVTRSGTWYWGSGDCRSARRTSHAPDFTGPDFGFRVVLAPTSAKAR